MHEICRQSEKERALRERSTGKSLGSCPPHFDFPNTCSPIWTWASNFLKYTFRKLLLSLCLQDYLSFQVLGALCHKQTNLTAVSFVFHLFRVSVLRHAGHDIRFDHRQPNHGLLSHGSELGAGERPPPDQQNRLDLAAPASALHQRVAPSGPGWGEAGEGLDHSGWEAPREQGLHEEVSPRLQQQRVGVDDGVRLQRKQAKSESFSSDNPFPLILLNYIIWLLCH